MSKCSINVYTQDCLHRCDLDTDVVVILLWNHSWMGFPAFAGRTAFFFLILSINAHAANSLMTIQSKMKMMDKVLDKMMDKKNGFLLKMCDRSLEKVIKETGMVVRISLRVILSLQFSVLGACTISAACCVRSRERQRQLDVGLSDWPPRRHAARFAAPHRAHAARWWRKPSREIAGRKSHSAFGSHFRAKAPQCHASQGASQGH